MASNFSESSLGLVAELVRWHLPARSLVRFKLVSKEWNTWCSQNLVELAKVRRQTPSRDWYFPIRTNAGAETKPLAAIHHPSAEEHEELEHMLPALDFLPNCFRSLANNGRFIHDYNIKAISGGLFLIKHSPVRNNRSYDNLYVVNPLTRKWRNLSYRDCCQTNVGGLSHLQMVVDESARTYTVIEFTDHCRNVYNSRSKHWVCYPIRINGPHQTQFSASACADGYIYVCSELYRRIDGWFRVDIRIFPIQRPSAEQQPTRCRVDLGDSRGSTFVICETPKLVECMGGIYIVVCGCEVSAIPHFVREVDHEVMMRWEFHIFKFQEGSRNCPLHVHHLSEVRLPGISSQSDLLGKGFHNFCCTAKSGVIWLACGDNHLLQYDVVSNVWKDGYRSIDSFSTENEKLLDHDYDLLPSAYTPSFDLSP
ncbi:hypothetical protein M758_1G177500 [Ceratodon purpureus]|nr:hypothetical protein M758_1G177500 [Ceratodon purpureus]